MQQVIIFHKKENKDTQNSENTKAAIKANTNKVPLKDKIASSQVVTFLKVNGAIVLYSISRGTAHTVG